MDPRLDQPRPVLKYTVRKVGIIHTQVIRTVDSQAGSRIGRCWEQGNIHSFFRLLNFGKVFFILFFQSLGGHMVWRR